MIILNLINSIKKFFFECLFFFKIIYLDFICCFLKYKIKKKKNKLHIFQSIQ